MLLVENLELIYNEIITAVKGVSIKVPIGEITIILGPNGSGKTSILRAIGGILKSQDGEITNGTISLEGHRIDGYTPEKISSLGVRLVPEGAGLFEDLTVFEHLRLAQYSNKSIQSKVKQDLFENVWAWFPTLKERKKIKVGYLSGGEQQMVSLAMVLVARPRILIMDEPSIGLAPIIVKELFGFLRRLNKEENVTILLVEQNAAISLGIANYGYILENGKIVLDGLACDLLNDKQVREYYLGIGDMEKKRSFRDVKHYKTRKRWLAS